MNIGVICSKGSSTTEGSAAPEMPEVAADCAKPIVAYESYSISGNNPTNTGDIPDALHDALKPEL